MSSFISLGYFSINFYNLFILLIFYKHRNLHLTSQISSYFISHFPTEGFFIFPYIYSYMKHLIKRILKEETESIDPKVIKVLKNFIIEYFSDVDWFKDVDFERSTWINSNSIPIPEIKITIYISDEDDIVTTSDFSELVEEIDFIMDMFYPMKDYLYTAVWYLDVKPV